MSNIYKINCIKIYQLIIQANIFVPSSLRFANKVIKLGFDSSSLTYKPKLNMLSQILLLEISFRLTVNISADGSNIWYLAWKKG